MSAADGMARLMPGTRAGRSSDLPSIAFLCAVAANTLTLALTDSLWLRIVLVLPQALLLIGCQETKHMCVHGTFLGNRKLNDMVGTVCAALFGVNFIAYRHFHYLHHHSPCTDEDPEGRLYSLSMNTRLIWLFAPVELPIVSCYINFIGWGMVPPKHRLASRLCAVWMLLFAFLVLICALHAWHALVWAYLVPLALFAWIDFILTQAEHYDADIVPAFERRDPGAITIDVVLPAGLGWLTLHRSLHRVHHRDPALRWFEASRRLRQDPSSSPVRCADFLGRWLAGGPRLWLRKRRVSPA
ncbi:MAG TPA: fatty acid desaturase [Burkholderiaceae bacterium]